MKTFQFSGFNFQLPILVLLLLSLRGSAYALPIEARLSTPATPTMKKLFYNISTDKCSYQPEETITFSLYSYSCIGI